MEDTMTPRIANPVQHAPAAIKAMMAVEQAIRDSGIEQSLLELVKLRASQINGCAYCIDMHWADARRHGASEQRLCMLSAWRDSALYSRRERAALAWAECLTHVADTGAPDADYAMLAAEFTEAEQVQISLQVAAINFWNRLQVGVRAVPASELKRHAA
jgi:AhpD family alkylhydroperoxidase